MGIKRVSETGIKGYWKRKKKCIPNGENFGIKNRGKYLPFRIMVHFLAPLVGARTEKILGEKGENFVTFFLDKMFMKMTSIG